MRGGDLRRWSVGVRSQAAVCSFSVSFLIGAYKHKAKCLKI